MRRHKEEPGRASSVGTSGGVALGLSLEVAVGLAELVGAASGGVGATGQGAALFVEPPRHLLVQHHVRGPATRGVWLDLSARVRGRAVDVPTGRPVVVAGVVVVSGLGLHSAAVHVERPRAPREDVRSDGADQGLAGDDDGLERGLSRCP